PARLGDGLDERAGGGHEILRPGDGDGAARAAVLVGAALPVLEALVAAHGVGVAPAWAAVGRPVVVVLVVAPHVHHPVDGAGTAEHPAAHVGDAAAGALLLRRGVEAPVEALLHLRRGVDDRHHPGHGAEPGPVGPARL